MKSFFENFFGRKREPPEIQNPAGRKYRNVQARVEPKFYKTGDVIGRKYEINRVLGQGGFGVVYLAFNRVTESACALKTIRDELLTDGAGLEAFKKEALLWVNLDRHLFILPARWVEKVYSRLFVEMDYVAPDARGRVNLADHLDYAGCPLETAQSLKWAVQFCVGMEHIQGAASSSTATLSLPTFSSLKMGRLRSVTLDWHRQPKRLGLRDVLNLPLRGEETKRLLVSVW